MTVCGGFVLGGAALGGSIVELCTICTPNLIVTEEQGLDNIGTYTYRNQNSK